MLQKVSNQYIKRERHSGKIYAAMAVLKIIESDNFLNIAHELFNFITRGKIKFMT